MGSVSTTLGRSLLVIAHPGHELRLYGWIKRAAPLVVILTDGSGSTGISRVDLSVKLLSSLGANIVIPGKFPEPELYELLLRGETAPFVRIVDELSALIRDENIDTLVCDASEGYHPAHDLCLPLARAAARAASRDGTALYEYRVVGDPRPQAGAALTLALDDLTLRAKIDCARGYAAASGSVLSQEVQYMFDTFGEESFRHEVLFPAGTEAPLLQNGLRYYEARGEERVRSGRYSEVLRYRQHLAPMEVALGTLAA